MRLHYQETAFVLPLKPNWDDVHKDVHTVVVRGASLPESGVNSRPFIWSATTIPGSAQALFTVRGRTLPSLADDPEARVVTTSLELKQHDQITIAVTLCPLKTRPGCPKRRKEPIPAPEYDIWLAGLLDRAGFALHRFRFFDIGRRTAQKREHTIWMPSVHFDIEASVTDPERAGLAYIDGLGRKRGYGFGLMEFYGEESA